MQILSSKLDKEAILNLLLKLTQKISKRIKKLKDKVYEISQVKILIDNFMELKNTYEINKKNGNISHSQSPSSHCHHHHIELNDNLKNIIKLMILELRKVYIAALESSSDLEKIFYHPLQRLTGDHETICENFNFEDIQREEFCKWVYKDDFMKTIIFQMKKKIANYEDISDLITEVEQDLNKGKKEMTRLEMCIAEEMRKICQANKKKEKFKDLDDLVNYINAEEDVEKPKCNVKKKNGKGSKKIQNNNNGKSASSKNEILNKKNNAESNKLDLEIEEFKNSLTINSVPAFSIRKIKPKLSKEWLSSLQNGVIV
jgi:hypothetical protein